MRVGAEYPARALMTLRELMGDVCPRVAGQAGSLRLGEVPEVEISGLAYSSRRPPPRIRPMGPAGTPQR